MDFLRISWVDSQLILLQFCGSVEASLLSRAELLAVWRNSPPRPAISVQAHTSRILVHEVSSRCCGWAASSAFVSPIFLISFGDAAYAENRAEVQRHQNPITLAFLLTVSPDASFNLSSYRPTSSSHFPLVMNDCNEPHSFGSYSTRTSLSQRFPRSFLVALRRHEKPGTRGWVLLLSIKMRSGARLACFPPRAGRLVTVVGR